MTRVYYKDSLDPYVQMQLQWFINKFLIENTSVKGEK